jgi:glycosyltransferase involved in cell wall biosynthesis
MSLVSIIIPCYNAGACLDEAVASALAQQGVEVEVVVVDDGSTEEATRLALARVSRLPGVRCFSQANAGPAAARNRALREARGAYILPLDADDLFEPGYAAATAAVLREQPEVGIVYCRARKFGLEDGPWTLPDYSPAEMAIDNVIFCSAMFRRDDGLRVGGYNERLRHGMEDYDFWLRLLRAGCGVVQLDEAYFSYRVQGASRTTHFMAVRPKVIETYAEIFRDHRDYFAAHAEAMYAFRFRQQTDLEHFRHRYGRIDAILQRMKWLWPVGRALNRLLARMFQ